jgi:hypothetical protein
MTVRVRRISPTPPEQGYYIESPVSGGGASALMAQVVQEASVRGLARAHYPITRGVFWDTYNIETMPAAYVDSGATHDLFLQTSGHAAHIAMIIRYAVYGGEPVKGPSPTIDVDLRNITGATVYDIGCQYTQNNGLEYDGNFALNLGTALLGIDYQPNEATSGAHPLHEPPSGGYTAATAPRPLYIPSAQRGDLLMIRVASSQCTVVHVDLLEVLS